MTTNKILLAGLVGAIVAFLLGFLVFGILLNDFFLNNTGSATGVMRGDTEMLWGPMILGHLTWGILLAVIFGRWANISTLATGAKAGALIGFLVSCTNSLINLGSTNIMNTTAAITNIIAVSIVSAIVGAAVAWFLGRETSKK